MLRQTCIRAFISGFNVQYKRSAMIGVYVNSAVCFRCSYIIDKYHGTSYMKYLVTVATITSHQLDNIG